MSITITTDVFCDGDGCSQWTHGVSGAKSDAKTARNAARRAGWKISRAGDYCPACAGGQDGLQPRASVYGAAHG